MLKIRSESTLRVKSGSARSLPRISTRSEPGWGRSAQKQHVACQSSPFFSRMQAGRFVVAATPPEAASVPTQLAEAEVDDSTVTLYLAAGPLQRSLLLEVLPEGKGQAVVVVGVLEGSQADKAGIIPGQKLLAISDPIRPDQMWPLGDRPSLRFVRDIFNAMRNKDVQLQLTSKAIYTSFAEAAMDAGTMSSDDDAIPLAPSNRGLASANGAASEMTVADRLAQRYDEARKLKQKTSDVQKRIEKRQAYMEEVSQRNDSSFVAWAVGLFLGPALLILLAAYFSGYLDNMYSNSLTAFK